MPALRVVVGEDDVLLREGIVRLLGEAGFEVVAQAGDAEDFLRRALAHRPDVAVVDVRMPPGHADDGLRAAIVQLVALGWTGREIADHLQLSHHTVRAHITDTMAQLGAHSRAQLVAMLLADASAASGSMHHRDGPPASSASA